jgi:glycosyltransferase involved in cell wall biosynthesis
MKIAVLNTRLSSYMGSCLKTFKQQTGAELLIYIWPNQVDAPFDFDHFQSLGQLYSRYDYTDKVILRNVLGFSPDAVLVSGWKDKGYVRICRQLKSHRIRIISGCDTQWKGSLRQRMASILSPLYVKKFIDVLWVTGERQRYFANALGFQGNYCWDGYYACDWNAFASSVKITSQQPPYFLYVGRYSPEKGLDTLAAAYQSYRQQVRSPWPLLCAGAGPLRDMIVASGAEDQGFIQPADLPALMQGAAAFILPSRSEPWGVVAQEASASGIPLILSDACGAGVHLLRPYHNGFSFPCNYVEGLADALKSMHELTDQQRWAYGQASYELSKQYTPQRWADTLLKGIQFLQTVS